jgi:hypothetical protein
MPSRVLAGAIARVEEHRGGSGPANGRSSRTYVHNRPVIVLPLARTGTVVSSPCTRAAAKTWRPINSVSGSSTAAAAPT